MTGHVPRGMTVLDSVMAGMDQINHLEYLGSSTFAAYPRGMDGQPDPTGIPELQIGSARASRLFEVGGQRAAQLSIPR